MAALKIAITIDDNMLKKLDILVKSKLFPNRSRAIQQAIAEKLMRLEKSRLAQECAKLETSHAPGRMLARNCTHLVYTRRSNPSE